jgi:hypothetical protein
LGTAGDVADVQLKHEAQVDGGRDLGFEKRARRDSNPKPSDP